jgi:hypothetical protein
MEMLYFIFKVQNKKKVALMKWYLFDQDKELNGGQDITTWWFTHLGSNARLVYFDFKALFIKKLIQFLLFVTNLWLLYTWFSSFEMWFGIDFFFFFKMCFQEFNLNISCVLFV